MRRITSALFLDFDNIFGGLLEVERDAAMALVERPGELIDRLCDMDQGAGVTRDLLVRRAYLNPKGSVADPELGNDNGRLYLNRYRPHLMRAGFEVIDCPALTSGQKNAADIRMVIDVLDAVAGPVRYDEVIIASSDADFTPLLLKLRAGDRRTMILTAGALAPPYRAVADRFIDEAQLIALLLDPPPPPHPLPDPNGGHDDGAPMPGSTAIAAGSAGPGATPDAEPLAPEQIAEAAIQAGEAIAEAVGAADSPLPLAAIGAAVHARVGTSVVRETKWFGRSTLTKFVHASQPHLRCNLTHVWDPSRHSTPTPMPTASPVNHLPPLVEEVSSITEMPRLSSATWAQVFPTLERAAATGITKLADAALWSRDQQNEAGLPAGRQAMLFTIRSCRLGGVTLDQEPPPTAADLRGAFVRGIVERAGASGLDLPEPGVAELDAWLRGQPEPARDPDPAPSSVAADGLDADSASGPTQV